MTTRIEWDEHEVALLIDSCCKVSGGVLSKAEAVALLSATLRKKAKDVGLTIDDVYRNTNGIALQMTKMDYLLTGGKKGLLGASKLFESMANMYLHNKPEYEKILQEAQKMTSNDISNRDRFFEWLSGKVSPAQLSSIFDSYATIEAFCLKIHILKMPLFETTDIKIIRQVLNTIESNRLFKLEYKRQLPRAQAAARYYYQYIKAITPNIQNDTQVAVHISESESEHPLAELSFKLSEILPDFGLGYQSADAALIQYSEQKEMVENSASSPIGYPGTSESNADHIERMTIDSSMNPAQSEVPQRTDADKKLAVKYPLAYPRVFRALLSAMEWANSQNVSVMALYSRINGIVSQDSITSILDQASWAKREGELYCYSATIAEPVAMSNEPTEENASQIVDFNNCDEYRFTKPVSLAYFESSFYYNFLSWKDLYMKAVELLYGDYPHIIKPDASKFLCAGTYYFANERQARAMRKPALVGNDIFIETNLSTRDMLVRLRIMLDMCNVDYENVKIEYKNTDDNSSIVSQDNKSILRLSNQINTSIDHKAITDNATAHLSEAAIKETPFLDRKAHISATERKREFEIWMQNTKGLSQSSVRSYLGGIVTCEKYARGIKLLAKPIYSVIELQELQSLMSSLLKDAGFIRMNTIGHNMYSAALNSYAEFLSDARGTVPAYKSITPVPSYEKSYEDMDAAFGKWLRDEQHLSDSTCKGYPSAIRTAERYASEHGFESVKLWTTDRTIVQKTADVLFADPKFERMNFLQNNRFRAAIGKLMLFLDTIDTSTPVVERPDVNLEPLATILQQHFARGFRIGSLIEMKKFRRFFETKFGESLDGTDAEIERQISQCGILFEDKLYYPETMLSAELKHKLLAYIDRCFAEGKKSIFFQALFDEFSEDLLDSYIYNPDMLKEYLKYANSGSFYIFRSYISKSRNATADPTDEIRDYLVANGAPIFHEDLFKALSHIPKDKVLSVLRSNREFVSNGRNQYFHIDIFHITDDALSGVKDIINQGIRDKEFISGNELTYAIRQKLPIIMEDNSSLSDLGIRNALAMRLADAFSFYNNIISRPGQELTMTDIFLDFCKNRVHFTLDELNLLANELSTRVYFDTINEAALRISQTEYVAKEQACFKVKETDDAISIFCAKEYIAINDVISFISFPDAGFPWNNFLLESYVAQYSKAYRLVHANYTATETVGAIVKRNSTIETFDDLATDVLAYSGCILTKPAALQYLCDNGYLARRHLSNIDRLLIVAQEKRNRKDK